VTREHKLALIVGFALILLVGVLISDHLSRARQAQIGPVTGGELTLAGGTMPPPIDPIRAIEAAAAMPGGPGGPGAPGGSGGGLGSGPPTPDGGSSAGFTPQVPVLVPAGLEIASAQPGSGSRLAGPGETVGQPGVQPEPMRVARPQVPTRQVTMRRDSVDQQLINEVLAQGGQVRTSGGMIEIIPASLVQVDGGRGGSSTGAAGGTAAPVASVTVHTVAKGESLSKIAAKYYGDGKLWPRLARYNGISDEQGLVQLGAVLKVPPKDVLLGKPGSAAEVMSPGLRPQSPPAPRSEPASPRPPRTELASAGPLKGKTLARPEPTVTYTVKKGDTLGEIARRTLGSSKRWPELAELNKLDDEDSIPAGTVLKLPPMRG
jgi:nucleoid-associated protein YgaU